MPTFFILHSQKNILREWYSYLETVILGTQGHALLCLHKAAHVFEDRTNMSKERLSKKISDLRMGVGL